jgi:hypothetical protein
MRRFCFLVVVILLAGVGLFNGEGFCQESSPPADGTAYLPDKLFSTDNPAALSYYFFSLDNPIKRLMIRLHNNHLASWPMLADFDLWRSLDSGFKDDWAFMETGPDTFDFRHIDAELQQAARAGVKTIFTPLGTPDFIARHMGFKPDNDGRRTCTCDSTIGTFGCYPPLDLNGDGSGTDKTWKGFITALATHVHAKHIADPTGYADIDYWEPGNEYVVNPQQWCGSYAQLARMMQDAKVVVKRINRSSTMLTTSMAWYNLYQNVDYLNTKANIPEAQTPAKMADIIDYHCYQFGNVNPERVVAVIHRLRVSTDSVPEAKGKTIFCSEGGWIKIAPATWTRSQNWLSRYLISVTSTGVLDFNLFQYDAYLGNNEQGPGPLASLWVPDTSFFCSIPAKRGFYCPADISWEAVYHWLGNITYNGPCTYHPVNGGKVWTCNHTSTGTYTKGQFVWYDLLDQSRSYTVPFGFTKEQDINGNITDITPGKPIMISNSPVLLMSFK